MNLSSKNYHLLITLPPEAFQTLEMKRIKTGEKKKDFYGDILIDKALELERKKQCQNSDIFHSGN